MYDKTVSNIYSKYNILESNSKHVQIQYSLPANYLQQDNCGISLVYILL